MKINLSNNEDRYKEKIFIFSRAAKLVLHAFDNDTYYGREFGEIMEMRMRLLRAAVQWNEDYPMGGREEIIMEVQEWQTKFAWFPKYHLDTGTWIWLRPYMSVISRKD